MLCKEKALQLSEGQQETFFISLGAADGHGRVWQESTFFDWFSKVEMERTEVKVRSAQDLRTYSKMQSELLGYQACPLTYIGGGRPTEHIYDLLKLFIKRHPNANIIVDEFPLLADLGVYNIIPNSNFQYRNLNPVGIQLG